MKRNKSYMKPLVAICQTSGLLLLEELPTDLPDQPFVYLGDSKELPKPTKSAILGEIELIRISLWCVI